MDAHAGKFLDDARNDLLRQLEHPLDVLAGENLGGIGAHHLGEMRDQHGQRVDHGIAA